MAARKPHRDINKKTARFRSILCRPRSLLGPPPPCSPPGRVCVCVCLCASLLSVRVRFAVCVRVHYLVCVSVYIFVCVRVRVVVE